MNARMLIEKTEKMNVLLFRNNNKIWYKAPKGALGPDMKDLLKKHKSEILRLIPAKPAIIQPDRERPFVIHHNDCLEVMKQMPDNTIDCIITDPPYGLKFMGKDWDRAIPDVGIWQECLRILKPGAFAFIMSAPRQDLQARMIINIEKAGFKTGFSPLYWTYATGFTKRHDISKAVDKALGVEQEILQRNPNSRENCNKSNTIYESGTVGKTAYITNPKTEQAKKLKGAYAGFQPKPAVEVILVAMKPLAKKSYTAQAMENGKGVTWQDDCQIPYAQKERGKKSETSSRVPANLLVSGEVLDDGIVRDGGYFPAKRGRSEYFGLGELRSKRSGRIKDNGKYSKFFSLDAWTFQNLPFLITSKPSEKEKKTGLESFEEKIILGRDFGQDQRNNPYKIRPVKRHNLHPTVKPIALMAYLVTLGSREGDLVLDPFFGTGTTGIASVILNRRSVGIEIDEHYCKIAEARMHHYQQEMARMK